MQTTAIEVSNLHKSYEDEPVLSGVSFSVGVGEIFGIAGRNGAGKTTTVEILQGLRSRDTGQVQVLGIDPGRERKRLRPIVGAQLQTSALPERLRVGEALRLFARLSGARVDWRDLAGLRAFFPLYLLGGGGPPKGAMTGILHWISNALPSAIPAIVDPWLGIAGLGTQLAVFGGWSVAAIAGIYWLARRA